MAYDVGAILQAIRTLALTGDIATAVGTRLYIASAEPNAALPYVVLTVVDVTPFLAFESDGGQMRLQFAIIADDSTGPVAVAGYAEDIRSTLSRAALTVSGLEVLGIDYDIMRGPFRDDDRWRVDADYIVRFLET